MDQTNNRKEDQDQNATPEIQSIQDLINHVTGKNLADSETFSPSPKSVNRIVFPFSDLVGLGEVKLGLILSIISPHITSILIAGPSNTGKSTAVRSLVSLLPPREESLCIYGCLPQHIEKDGINAVCPDCARKYGQGLPISTKKDFFIIEIPSNISIKELTGHSQDYPSKNDNQAANENTLFSLANQNILYSGNIQELEPSIIKSILDTAQSKSYQIRHNRQLLTLQTQFTFITETNLPEKLLNIPYLDSFDFVITAGSPVKESERKKVRQNVNNFYTEKQKKLFPVFPEESAEFVDELYEARDFLEEVLFPKYLEKAVYLLLTTLKINSLNAEHVLIEACRASAAADNRMQVNVSDIKSCAYMTLRHHLLQPKSAFQDISEADKKIQKTLFNIFPE